MPFCKNDTSRKYKGTEPSPKGLGYCAHTYKINLKRKGKKMKILVTVNISKGFDKWTKMSKDLAPEAEKNGIKTIWAGANPDETEVYVVVEVQDPIQMKTFGEREDIAKAREEAGADVASTKIISPIGKDFIPT